MPSYEYFLIEKTVLHTVIEADSKEDADQKAEELVYGDMDWGFGAMEVNYQFIGELNNA